MPTKPPVATLRARAADWHLDFDRARGRFTAIGNLADGDTRWAAAPTVWRLEEQLGFVIPEQVHAALRDAALGQNVARRPERRARRLPRLDNSHRPAGADPVFLHDRPLGSYGRLLHTRPPFARWSGGTITVELSATLAPEDQPGAEDAQPAYGVRLSRAGVPFFCAEGPDLPDNVRPRDPDTLRQVLTHLSEHEHWRHVTGADRTALARDLPVLAAYATGGQPPLEPGVAVAVRIGLGQVATGTILRTIEEPASRTVSDIVWTPDLATLTGHPWHGPPARQLISPVGEVTPGVAERDNGLDRGPLRHLLMFGARVRSIDDPRWTTATVLRTFPTPGGFRHDIRPDEDQPYALDPTVLTVDAVDVDAIQGTAWPNLDRMISARVAAGIGFQVGEILLTPRTVIDVVAGGDGRPALGPSRPRSRPRLDPIAGLDSPGAADSSVTIMRPAGSRVRITIPGQEALTLDRSRVVAELGRPAGQLRERLRAAGTAPSALAGVGQFRLAVLAARVPALTGPPDAPPLGIAVGG